MVNPRAYILANSISETTLPLEIFRPGTLSLPESDRPISDMRETQKAFSVYQALTRRAKPWDLSTEVLQDFFIETEWFLHLERPVCGYYRRPSYPAFRAVADLIVAVNRSVVQLLPIRSIMLDTTEVRRIHAQRCSESPENWAHTQQSANTRAEPSRKDKPSTTSSRRNKPSSSASSNKDAKARVKERSPSPRTRSASPSTSATHVQGQYQGRVASSPRMEHPQTSSTHARCKKPHAMATNH